MTRETLRRWAPVALLLAVEIVLLWGDGALLIVLFAAGVALFPALYADEADEIAARASAHSAHHGRLFNA